MAVHIDVCICTYQRPGLLARLLDKLRDQATGGAFTYAVVVADNDAAESGRAVTEAFAAAGGVPVTYCVEPRQNIALVRNRALANARGDYVAFIDDDEYPLRDWLQALWTTCVNTGADGVLGPVRPDFEVEPPVWVRKGRFFDRPEHETGYRITMSDARTGNVLLRTAMFERNGGPFREAFGTGGEDVDFFRRMRAAGRVFVWCRDAVVYETVPAARCRRRYLLRRALLRGQINSQARQGRARRLARALVAVAGYTAVLPFLFVAGQHHGMRYLIKWCDHAGLILAVLNLNPVRVRTS